MKYRKSVGILVAFIAGLSLLAGIIGILPTTGTGVHTFSSLHGEVVHLYGKGIYSNDSVAAAVQAIAQDWVTVFLGVPLLALSCYFAGKSSLRARILLAGTLAYFLYTYMSYSFLCMYNPLFLVYVALMSMSFFALILVMLSFDLELLKNAFSDDLPVKAIGIVILVFAGTISLMWLGRIVPPLFTGSVPIGLEDYLDNKPFAITDIGTSDVQFRDPALAYPIFRAESRENFENLLRRDSRNGPITEFLTTDLGHTDADLREALTSGLLEQRDKEHIAGYFRENEDNTRVAQRLSDTYAGTSDTIELTTGETADFFATTTGFEVDIHDKYNSKRTASWDEIAPILRTLYQREQDGFSHAPVLREPANLTGKPSYEAGDHAVLDYGGRELSGTVGYVGEKDVRIDTGPYSWSHEVVSRDAFENGIRQDDRNTALFTPEQPAAENFRITDNHLGEGGAKTKYGYNIAAIRTLKTIEAEGLTATPEEQETLSRYVGWGGIPQTFDPNNASWAKEYAELVSALTAEEYEMARASTLNAHYTMSFPHKSKWLKNGWPKSPF